MDKKSIKFLEVLCKSPGPSGFEKPPTDWSRNMLRPMRMHLSRQDGQPFFERTGKKEGVLDRKKVDGLTAI